jgi:hypothetical protein
VVAPRRADTTAVIDRDGVADQADDPEHDHGAAGDLGRLEQASHTLDQHEHSDGQQDGGLSGGGQHLRAQEPPRFALGLPGGRPAPRRPPPGSTRPRR